MKRSHYPFFALSLAACFLFVSVVLSGQAASHSLHHAAHKAATHSSALCSWLCAAGQVLQAYEFEVSGPFFSLDLVVPVDPTTTDKPLVFSPFSRAPPCLAFTS